MDGPKSLGLNPSPGGKSEPPLTEENQSMKGMSFSGLEMKKIVILWEGP